MRFLVRLKNDRCFSPKDVKRLALRAYNVVRIVGADLGNLRVSSSAVEFDLLTDSKEAMGAGGQPPCEGSWRSADC
jgi:hypothetical protein